MFLHRDRDFSKATVDARAFVDQFAQKALDYGAAHSSEKGTSDDPGNRYVFLYELAKQTSDKKMLTDQLLNILLAGRDTTASLLSITCFILARRREIWDKLRDEVLRLESEVPTFEDLKSMKYLNWVLNESKFPLPVSELNSCHTLATGGIATRGKGSYRDARADFCLQRLDYIRSCQ